MDRYSELLPPRSARAWKSLPAETERSIVAEYQGGHTMKEIAARHGLHRVMVGEVLDRTGTAKRPRGMNATQVSLPARLDESGESLAFFGAQLGFNVTTVRIALMGVDARMRDPHGRLR